MKKHLVLLLLAGFAWGSCQGPTQVTALLGLSKSVLDLINSFVSLHKEFTSQTNEVVITAHKGLHSKENSLSEVATFWEFYWYKIERKYSSLTAHLKKVEINSQEYFSKLNENNAAITDTSLRRMDFERNELKQAQWLAQHEKTAANLKKAEEMIKKGRDWTKILANAAAREELALFIKDMEAISYMAKFTLPADIKHFENNARLIFKSE